MLFGHILLSIFCIFTCGSVYQALPSTQEDHPDKCWDPNEDKFYSPGDVFTDTTHCVKTTCRDDLTFILETCSKVITDEPNCEVIDNDRTLKYPECCPSLECDKKG